MRVTNHYICMLIFQKLKMSRVSKAVQRLVGGSLQLTNGQRAVSTSARAENSLSLDMDVNVKVRRGIVLSANCFDHSL